MKAKWQASFWRAALGVTLALLAAPRPTSAQAVANNPLDPSPFGVNFLKWEFLKGHADVWMDLRQRMTLMKAAGITWDRDGIDKNTVNPKPGVWDWGFTDKVIALAGEQHIHLAVILMGGPPPRDEAGRAAYAEYVYQTVHRYKGSIKVWEIWNEPNIPSFWKNPDVKLYTLMLKAAYAAAKRADPSCVVLGGSANGPGNDWFNGIADEGGWDSCDAISLHPYAMSPDPIKQRLDLILHTINGVVRAHGPKPVWITEDGWRAAREPAEEAKQATRVFQTYVIALANGVHNIDYFCMDDYDHWGLLHSSQPFDPKPSYTAVQTLTRALGAPGPAAPFVGYLKMPSGVAGFVFRRPGRRRVIILWNNDDEMRTITLPQRTGLTAMDILQNPVPVTQGRLTLGQFPIIVSGADIRRLGPVSPAFDPFTLPKGTNLIYNGALDAAPDTTVGAWKTPGNWYPGVFNAGGKDADLRVTGGGRGGSTCLSIAKAAGAAAWNNAIIPAEPGKRYKLTAWVKTQAATGKNVAQIVWYSGNMWTPMGAVDTVSQAGTQDWTLVTTEGVCPRDAMFVRVHLRSEKNTGTVSFDDVALVEE